VKIGVLSDTHFTDLSTGMKFLGRLCDKTFRDAEIILHAGDVVNHDILMAFAGKTVHVVRGNMDPPVRGVPNRKIIEVEGFRIGLIHGWGAPETLEEMVVKEFSGRDLDVIVFGHSHYPVCHSRSGILLFNPGSPTDRRWAPSHTVGILELGDTVEGRIIQLGD